MQANSGRALATEWGPQRPFRSPHGVVLDPTGNVLYIADYDNNLIREVNVTGYSIDKSLPNGLVFDPLTGVISGTPAIASPAETYTITAYNSSGSSSATVVIQIDEQSIVFAPIPPKTVCDADFDPGATGAGPVTYTSNDPSIATIVSGKVHITGVRALATIIANDGSSQAAQTLTVIAAITPVITITPAAPDTCAGKNK